MPIIAYVLLTALTWLVASFALGVVVGRYLRGRL
jgi:hypothetical protein